MLIGLTGHMQVGKSTVGQFLAQDYGFRVQSFAAPLKRMAIAIDPFVAVPICSTHPEDPENVCFRRLSTVVTKLGWDAAKQAPDVRRFLQRLGTEGGRRILGAGIWVDHAMENLDHEVNNVFTDVRFGNEADAIDWACGAVWRITRPGYDGDGHASEREIDTMWVDFEISNSGTIEDLHRKVEMLMREEYPEVGRKT